MSMPALTPRAGSRGPTPRRGHRTQGPGRGPPHGPPVGLQVRRGDLRSDRVRTSRLGPPGRRPRPRSRSLRAEKRGYRGSSVTCPHCGEAARFVNYRPKRFVSLVGDIRFARGYYHCSHCGHGHFPWDETLRVSPQCLTLATQEVTTLAGIQESFGKAAERTLLKLTGLRLSESTVERTTEAAGQCLGELLEQGAVF